MACPDPADMSSCDPKCRCNAGPCADIAYSCSDPCSPGQYFNYSTCECTEPCDLFRLTVTLHGGGYSQTNCNASTPNIRPAFSKTVTVVQNGLDIQETCTDIQWTTYPVGDVTCYIPDGSNVAEYILASGATCNEGGTNFAGLTDTLSGFYAAPFSVCPSFYYTVDQVEISDGSGGWIVVS